MKKMKLTKAQAEVQKVLDHHFRGPQKQQDELIKKAQDPRNPLHNAVNSQGHAFEWDPAKAQNYWNRRIAAEWLDEVREIVFVDEPEPAAEIRNVVVEDEKDHSGGAPSQAGRPRKAETEEQRALRQLIYIRRIMEDNRIVLLLPLLAQVNEMIEQFSKSEAKRTTAERSGAKRSVA